MAGKIIQVRLDLTGDAVGQFELIKSWLDIHAIEGANSGQTAVAIFSAGLEVYLKAMDGEPNNC